MGFGGGFFGILGAAGCIFLLALYCMGGNRLAQRLLDVELTRNGSKVRLLALADKLAAGELKVTDEERQAAYQGTDAFLFEEDGTRKPLEEVRAVLDKRLVEEKFEKKTAALAAKAAVTVHRDTLDKVRYN